MRPVHPRSSPPRALAAALVVSVCVSLSACFKNDGGTSSDGASESSGGATGGSSGPAGSTGAITAPTTGDPGSSGSSGADSLGSSSTTAAPGSTGDDTGAAVDCSAYCDLVMENCSGDFSQYGTPGTCMTSCAAFPPGSPGDMSGNSLACRHYHAGLAFMLNDVHCGHAGPGGDTACGSNCEGFCAIAGAYCPDAWPDDAACLAACDTFPKDEVYDANDVAGDTFACRLYHATAASLDPTTHCGHIKGDSPTCK